MPPADGAIVGGTCLFAGLFVLQATTAVWTVETLEIFTTVTYGGVETGQHPLAIYRPWFRRFFTVVVPIATANYLPTLSILGRAGVGLLPGLLAPLVGVGFLGGSLAIWGLGVRRYLSTGS